MRFRIASLALSAALLAACAFVFTRDASAGGEVSLIYTTSTTVAVGQEGTIDLRVSLPEGVALGAWTIDVTYDSTVAAMTDCSAPHPYDVCSPAYSPDAGRMTGAYEPGLPGHVYLGSFTFLCADVPGETDLEPNISVFADNTPGNPTDIDPVDTDAGTLSCVIPGTATPPSATGTPAATGVPAATAAAVLPDTGGGASGSSSGLAAVVLLGALGVIGLALAFRLRARP